MNTKILASLMVIALVAGVGTAGTFAYFSDTETSSDNTFQAGYLDLHGVTGTGVDFPISISDVAPGDEGTAFTSLATDDGGVPGELDVSVGTVSNSPGTTPEPEPTTDSGELGANAKMAPYLDLDLGNSWTDGDIGLKSDGNTYTYSDSSTLQYDTIDAYSGTTWDAVHTFTGGDNEWFQVAWKVPTSVENEIMDDSSSFDMTFTLEQPGANTP